MNFFCPNCPFSVFIILLHNFFVRFTVRSCSFPVATRVCEYGARVFVVWCEYSSGAIFMVIGFFYWKSGKADKKFSFFHAKRTSENSVIVRILVFKRTKRTKRTTKRTNFFFVNPVVSSVSSTKRTNGQNCVRRVCKST